MLKNNYICALDIGSSKIAAAVAKVKKKQITDIFFESIPSVGVKSGIIVDSIEVVNSITKLLKNLRAKSGINFKYINTNISGQDIATKHSRAIIPLADRGNKVVAASDIERVNEQARVLGSSLEEEIIHSIASSYTIDSKINVANPIGLYSHKLEVDLYLVYARLSSMQGIIRVINQSGYEIKDLFFSGLATSSVVFDEELNKGINLFCDIGSDIAELLLFRDGVLSDIEILRIGGNDLTRQLAEALKISFELAEDIKRSHGYIGEAASLDEDKEILIKKQHLYKPVKQKMVSEVINSQARLIASTIKDAVEKKVSLHEANNFIVAGRTVLLEGFIEMLENALAIPVKLGRISSPCIPGPIQENDILSGQKYLTYLTALGMIIEALKELTPNTLFLVQPSKNLITQTINRFKEVYQEYF